MGKFVSFYRMVLTFHMWLDLLSRGNAPVFNDYREHEIRKHFEYFSDSTLNLGQYLVRYRFKNVSKLISHPVFTVI